jgi:hypothetical protein
MATSNVVPFLEFPSIGLMEQVVRALHAHPDKGWSVKNWELESKAVRFDFMGDRYRVSLDGGIKVEWLSGSARVPEVRAADLKLALERGRFLL